MNEKVFHIVLVKIATYFLYSNLFSKATFYTEQVKCVGATTILF